MTSTEAIPPLDALLAAADRGDLAQVRLLIGAHPAIANQRGRLRTHSSLRSALHVAVSERHHEVVALLLEHGADPNVRDDTGATPLHLAAETNELPMIELLVGAGADTNAEDALYVLNVLAWASVKGEARNDVVQYLTASGARHSIHSAVAIGDVDAITNVAARDIAALDTRLDRANRQRTPLHLAVLKKQFASVQALLELGASVNETDTTGLTPLDVAALNGQHDHVELLLRYHARVELPAAVALGRIDDIARIISAEPAILLPGNLYGGLLIQAASRASEEVFALLVEHGASVHASASADLTVDAARGFAMLVQHGASVHKSADAAVNVHGTLGFTALHAAAFSGNANAVRALLKCGASARARERRYGASPAGWARRAGHHDVAAIILDADIDIFDAIENGLVARVSGIVARDPGALTRAFREYVTGQTPEHVTRPAPHITPLMAANERGNSAMITLMQSLLPRLHEIEREELISRFLRSACSDWRVGGGGEIQMARGTASRLLQQHPDIATENIFTAVVCGNITGVEQLLTEAPAIASQPGGPRNWPPLLYLATARLTQVESSANAVHIAQLLLDSGADVNAHYPGGNDNIAYSVLTCVVGMGEHQAPAHAHARELVALLLDRGAEPYDAQLLYEVFANHASRAHLNDDLVWLLELLYQQSVKLGRAKDWADSEWRMLDMGGYRPGAHFLLSAAASNGLVRMVEWMLAHGASPNALSDNNGKARQSPLALAMSGGHSGVAELLKRHGAVAYVQPLNEYDHFVDACMRLDGELAAEMLWQHPEYLSRTSALFDAVRNNQADVVSLLIGLGLSPDIADANMGNRRALHVASFAGSTHAASALIALGADVDARETRYGATPLGVAIWAQRPAMVALLGERSRDIFNLTFAGNVSRVQRLLHDDPALATTLHANGDSLLMWLPEDEEAAVLLTRTLLSLGADPALHDVRGMTALRLAERRALAGACAVLRDAMRMRT